MKNLHRSDNADVIDLCPEIQLDGTVVYIPEPRDPWPLVRGNCIRFGAVVLAAVVVSAVRNFPLPVAVIAGTLITAYVGVTPGQKSARAEGNLLF